MTEFIVSHPKKGFYNRSRCYGRLETLFIVMDILLQDFTL